MWIFSFPGFFRINLTAFKPTHYELNVAGQPREVELPAALLANSMPQALRSDLPARLYPNGRLQVQLKPGNWHLEVDAR